jgi:hypothetical protein
MHVEVNMGYRIVEASHRGPGFLEGAVEVAEYDSAYKAMAAMRREFVAKGSPPSWYLLDTSGEVLIYPDDIYDVI